jgi:ribosome-binding factor A
MSNKPRRTRAPEAPISSSAVNNRHVRIEHLLLEELQGLLRDEVTDPALEGITLLSVHLSPDAGHARLAYVVTAPLHDEAERGRRSKEGLIRATGFLRARLAQQLNLKKLPKLSFTFVGVQEGGAPCPE